MDIRWRQHDNYTQFNNFADVSTQGRHVTHTLRVVKTAPEGTYDTRMIQLA